MDGSTERPDFEAFLARLKTLPDQQLRELAELPRVPDWRRDGDLRNLIPGLEGMGYQSIATQNAERSGEAMRSVRALVGDAGVRAAHDRVDAALGERRPKWRLMGLHRPLRVVSVSSLVIFGVLAVRDLQGAVTAPLIAVFVIALIGLLGEYLLPPSSADLRTAARQAALAHAAGPRLDGDAFEQLAGGWYAVLDGRWRRGPRPYAAWGCLVGAVILALLMWALVAWWEATVGPI